ncbi:MAG: hypothetical protein V1819_01845 [bacterium]
MKTILVVILAGLVVVLVGVFAYQKLNQPEQSLSVNLVHLVPPIATTTSVNQKLSCASRADCVLAFTGTNYFCGFCDSADPNLQCVSAAEAGRLQQEKLKKNGGALCETCCSAPLQVFACACQNGFCNKVNCVAEGKIGRIETNNIKRMDDIDCCSGLVKTNFHRYWKGCEGNFDQDGSYFICTKCGDGLCGEGEDECNCPRDCKGGEFTEWKTYRDNQYGFEIDYPSFWYSGYSGSLIFDKGWYDIVNFSNSANRVSDLRDDNNVQNSGFIQITKSEEIISDTQQYFDDILKPILGAGRGSDVFKSYLIVGGFLALKTEYQMPGLAGIITAYMVKDKMPINIQLFLPDTTRVDPICDDYEKIFDHMVSTFKFIK